MELFLTQVVDADNPVVGDLHIRKGDLVWTKDIAEETSQQLRVNLQFFLGEWFLNQAEGTPWFQQLLEKGTTEQTVKAIISKIIVKTEGVKTIDFLTYNLDAAARKLFLDFGATLQDGSTFVSKDFPPFIVEL